MKAEVKNILAMVENESLNSFMVSEYATGKYIRRRTPREVQLALININILAVTFQVTLVIHEISCYVTHQRLSHNISAIQFIIDKIKIPNCHPLLVFEKIPKKCYPLLEKENISYINLKTQEVSLRLPGFIYKISK